jgi:hypothetical protein
MDEDTPEAEERTAPTTEGAFQEALRELVLGAASNGVDVRGGWSVGRADETKQWDVEIIRLSGSSTAHVLDADAPVASVVEAVAERGGVEPTALPPLQDAVDPETLETLVNAGSSSQQRVRFQYYGYRITVRSDGSIRLE